jgi:hypothetical protein
MKNSNDTIGNRTRDRQACNAVPQPTVCTTTGLVKSKFYPTKVHEEPGQGVEL